MFDGGASQRENSVADDLPDLAWVANTPGGDQIILLCRRRRPPRDIPLNQPTKISLLKHTLLDRLTIAPE